MLKWKALCSHNFKTDLFLNLQSRSQNMFLCVVLEGDEIKIMSQRTKILCLRLYRGVQLAYSLPRALISSQGHTLTISLQPGLHGRNTSCAMCVRWAPLTLNFRMKQVKSYHLHLPTPRPQTSSFSCSILVSFFPYFQHISYRIFFNPTIYNSVYSWR